LSMQSSKAKIHHAFKELTVAWAEAREQWNDPASDHFRERFLDPLEARVRAAVGAIERMDEVMAKVKRDCGDQ